MSQFTMSVLVSVFFMMLSQPLLAADSGIFMVVKGTVKVISGKDKSTAPAKVGSKVFSGDTVITEKDSRAKIVMADRNVIQLSPETRFEIINYKTSEVENERTAQLALIEGKVRVQVEQKYGEKNKFEMRTPTAVAGVRGTQYVVQYNPSTSVTSIMVMNGKVMVAPVNSSGAKEVPVTPNQGVNVGSNTAKLEIFPVTKEQVNSFSNMSETKSLDNFKKDKSDSSGNIPKEEKNSAKEESKNESPRTPASEVKQERMITSEDHGGEALANPKNAPPPAVDVKLPPPPPPPPKPVATPTIPPTVKDAVQSTGSKTKVIVTPAPQ